MLVYGKEGGKENRGPPAGTVTTGTTFGPSRDIFQKYREIKQYMQSKTSASLVWKD